MPWLQANSISIHKMIFMYLLFTEINHTILLFFIQEQTPEQGRSYHLLTTF